MSVWSHQQWTCPQCGWMNVFLRHVCRRCDSDRPCAEIIDLREERAKRELRKDTANEIR